MTIVYPSHLAANSITTFCWSSEKSLYLHISVGIPKVNLAVTDNCLDIKASWNQITGECSNSRYMVNLTGGSNVTTSDTSHTFNNTVNLTGDISVSVVALNGNAMGSSVEVSAQPSPSSKCK